MQSYCLKNNKNCFYNYWILHKFAIIVIITACIKFYLFSFNKAIFYYSTNSFLLVHNSYLRLAYYYVMINNCQISVGDCLYNKILIINIILEEFNNSITS